MGRPAADPRVATVYERAVKKMKAEELDHRLRSASHVNESLAKKGAAAMREMEGQTPNGAYRFGPAPRLEAHGGKVGPFSYGVCHLMGRRPSMEDESIATEVCFAGKKARLFGVCDGHGGNFVAQFVRDRLPNVLKEQLEKRGRGEEGIWNALKMAFVEVSDLLRPKADEVGSTVVLAMELEGKLWVANVGDARAVLSAGGEAMQLSVDMKPGTVGQPTHVTQRIINRGGMTCGFPPRIGGLLATGGAIGDHAIVGVSPRPTITCWELAKLPQDSFLVLGCDGIFDVATTKQVVEGVHQFKHLSCPNLARATVGSSYQALSMDNLSALVVRLK